MRSKCPSYAQIVPTSIFNYIAIRAAECANYDSLVTLIETQTMDPITGLSRGEKTPSLNELTNTEPKLQEVLAQMGVDPESEWAINVLAAFNKGKGKGK